MKRLVSIGVFMFLTLPTTSQAGGVRNYGLFFATVPLISLTTFTLIWAAYPEPPPPLEDLKLKSSVPAQGFEEFFGVDRRPTARARSGNGLTVTKVVNVSR